MALEHLQWATKWLCWDRQRSAAIHCAVRVHTLQDVVAGDGTTSVVVICGALLKKCQELLEKGVHPTVISDAFGKAAGKSCEVRELQCCAADVCVCVCVRVGERGEVQSC
jgi:hypothetical protein